MKSLLTSFILLFALQLHSQEEPKHFSRSKNRFKIGTDLGRGNPLLNYECLVDKGVSIEFGFGLTFDDTYAIQNWDGHQYIPRDSPGNTRYSLSFGINFLPVPKVSFLYMGIEGKIRKYYSSDDQFLHSSGMFLGAKRNEAIAKLKVGNYFQFNHFLIDYSVGLGYMISNDEWGYFANVNPMSNYTKGEGTITRSVVSVELKMGLGGKKGLKTPS